MLYPNMCGAFCEPEGLNFSKEDRKTLLKEKEAILVAKLATIRHWIEDLDKNESKSNQK